MGMAVFAKTRKRQLVDMLHDHGISISYNRVLYVSAQLGDAAVAKYVEDGVVCPPDLRRGLFSTAAMDNIDHNPAATTATSSLHGTNSSMFQHPTTDNEGEKREPLQLGDKKTEGLNVPGIDLLKPQLTLEYEWLGKVCVTEEVEGAVNVTWSANHASNKRSATFEVSITALLPLLWDQAHSFATIKHVMDKWNEWIGL